MPVGIIAGLDDPICNYSFLRQIARSHPHVDYQAWPGDHYLPLTDETRAMALIVDITDVIHSAAAQQAATP